MNRITRTSSASRFRQASSERYQTVQITIAAVSGATFFRGASAKVASTSTASAPSTIVVATIGPRSVEPAIARTA